MIRGRDGHGVDALAHLVEHHPEIAEAAGVWEFLEGVRRPGVVHIAERDEVFGIASGDVHHAFPPTPMPAMLSRLLAPRTGAG